MNQLDTGTTHNSSKELPPFSEFIDALKAKMHQVFHVRGDIDNLALRRGLPPFVLREIMSINPLAVGIPKEYGGRGGQMNQNIELLATTSYESLALSLTFGINSALFLQPFGKFGNHEAKAPVFRRFLEEKSMGGLMITEPDFGRSKDAITRIRPSASPCDG